MRSLVLITLIFAVFFTGFTTGCSKKQEEAIKERTNLGLGDMVKAKDKGIEGNLTESLALDPITKFYAIKASVSHDVVTLTGTVKTEEQKQHAEDIVRNTGLERIKEIINDILVDPDAPETPFDW
jgi:osmotically-inducible protein OsmY